MKITRLIVAAIPFFLFSCASPDGGVTESSERALLNGPLPHMLGQGKVAETGVQCSLSASAPSKSSLKRQELQFAIHRSDFTGWSTQRFLVHTGSSKSLAEVQSILASALHRAATAPRGTELAKIGDIKLGGELRLVAGGGGEVDFAYNPHLPDGNPSLTAGEAAFYASLLNK